MTEPNAAAGPAILRDIERDDLSRRVLEYVDQHMEGDAAHDRAAASERSADVARQLLGDLGIAIDDVELVADAIRDHSFTRGAVPESMLGKALQDADRLEALGVIGTFRCIATGVRLDAPFFDAIDPWAVNRALDDKRFSVDHFFTKLLSLPATFQTTIGRQEAERRAAFMRRLLAELGTELDWPLPAAGA